MVGEVFQALLVAGFKLVEEEGLFLGGVGIGSLKLDELNDGQAVLDEVGMVTGKGFMSLVKGLLGLEKEEVVTKKNEEEGYDNFRKKRLHEGIIYP